jgi:hypothetical protein
MMQPCNSGVFFAIFAGVPPLSISSFIIWGPHVTSDQDKSYMLSIPNVKEFMVRRVFNLSEWYRS